MDDEIIGKRVWFPKEWEEGTVDSILKDGNGQALAYIIRRDNGKLIAVDMQGGDDTI